MDALGSNKKEIKRKKIPRKKRPAIRRRFISYVFCSLLRSVFKLPQTVKNASGVIQGIVRRPQGFFIESAHDGAARKVLRRNALPFKNRDDILETTRNKRKGHPQERAVARKLLSVVPVRVEIMLLAEVKELIKRRLKISAVRLNYLLSNIRECDEIILGLSRLAHCL